MMNNKFIVEVFLLCVYAFNVLLCIDIDDSKYQIYFKFAHFHTLISSSKLMKFELMNHYDLQIFTVLPPIIKPKPTLSSDLGFLISEGDSVTITCSINFPSIPVVTISLEFEFNGENLQSDENRQIAPMQNDGLLRQSRKLIISSLLESRDQGDYKCIMREGFARIKISESVTKTLNFIKEAKVTFENILSDTIEVSENSPEAKFSVKYIATASATIYIFNVKNKLISKDNKYAKDMDKKYNALVHDNRIDFTVISPTYDDSGKFTIMAECAGKNFNKTLILIVGNKPTVIIDNAYVYVHTNETAKILCRVTSYLESNLTCGKHWILTINLTKNVQ